MPARRYKPTSAGRRNSSVLTRDSVTRDKPEKKLTTKLHKTGGRNNKGRITTRHIGGGHKRGSRPIDFKRRKEGGPATGAGIQYTSEEHTLEIPSRQKILSRLLLSKKNT